MTWWHYLLLANLYLVLFYAFYALFLRRETFFQLNRVYLVGASLLSFLIPMIQSDWVKHLFITQRVQQTIYNLDPMVIYRFAPQQAANFTIGQMIGTIYVVGIIFLSFRLVWQLVMVRCTIMDDEPTAAYSFFNELKVGEEVENREVIEAHEMVHMRQWHSADIILTEIVMIINWFNPVVYLYRQAIKHIHEFIADRDAVKAGTSKAEYAMLLLSQSFTAPAHQLVNPFFNQSLLKQRIKMLQKSRSGRVALVKYGLSAPLFALMLILSSATVIDSKVVNDLHERVVDVFLSPTNEVLNVDKMINSLGKDNVPVKDSVKSENEMKLPAIKKQAIESDVRIDEDQDQAVFTAVEQVPSFPGGIDAFYRFISKNVRYPQEMRENNVQGRVMVQFVVERDGSLSNIHSVRDKGYGSGEEAVRVLSLSPKWSPGYQNGLPVRVQYTVPIVFALQDQPTVFLRDTLTNAPTGGKQQFFTLRYNTSGHFDTSALRSTVVYNQLKGQPLVLVDGRVVSSSYFDNLKPANIKSIDVIKSTVAVSTYGTKATDGALIITTKNKTDN